MSKKGNPGANNLANTLSQMVQGQTESPLVIDFGVINPDMSLKTNTYGPPIPYGDYSICRSVTYDPGVPLTQSYNDGAHSQPDAGYGGAHTHNIRLPEKMYRIQPGDRVLVAWVDEEAVVIDVVYNSKKAW